MIDTLARHLAALHEARRLVRMVLVNNPAFVALETVVATPDGPAAAALTDDRYYQAFLHLNDAIGLLSPEPGAEPAPADATLCERIVELAPAAPSLHQQAPPAHMQCVSLTCEQALPTLSERVRYVLEEQPAESPSLRRDEAHVAIVRHDKPQDSPQPLPPGGPV